nr:MAG TPA: hypothetical protein [Caudoviricetes sp.]
MYRILPYVRRTIKRLNRRKIGCSSAGYLCRLHPCNRCYFMVYLDKMKKRLS